MSPCPVPKQIQQCPVPKQMLREGPYRWWTERGRLKTGDNGQTSRVHQS